MESELQFKGSFASAPDGFYTLTLSIPRADEDGGARTEDYIFVVTRNDIRMMRVDVRLAELITLTR
ncbi:MAG: hypothetical protein HY235_08605 [Acidobacteria bacterium]|nr:hypothetical protein [Acidobacteriota bacterium]